MKNNYYETLGVTPDSEADEIKSAYRKLARKFHPDICNGNTKKFKEINEAYEVLSNARKRMQYNMLFGFYKTCPSYSSNTKNSNQEEKSSFEEKRPEMKQQKAQDKSQIGTDLNAEISITMSEAKNGTTKVVNILHIEQCPRCKGRKFINGSYCSECNGTGEKSEQRKLSVKIPANIKNLTKLRIKNEGNVGKNGGENGDLFLTIKIEGNKNIQYDGRTIHYNMPITPYEAVLGGTISLNTLEGNILIKIPSKTRSGQKFRVREEVQGKIFEIFVTVYIEIPAYLSDDEIKLYEKLKKLSNHNIRENFIND